MTLRGVHLVFVGAAVLLSIFFGVWAYGMFKESQNSGYLITAISSFLIAAGLVVYGKKFAQKTGLIK